MNTPAAVIFAYGAYAQAKALYDSIPDSADASAKSAECDAQLAQMQERAKEQLIGKWLSDKKYNDYQFNAVYSRSYTYIADELVFIDEKNLDKRIERRIEHCTYEIEGSKLIIYESALLNTTLVEEYYFSMRTPAIITIPFLSLNLAMGFYLIIIPAPQARQILDPDLRLTFFRERRRLLL
ncbi:MAG: hypothetical protein LBL25_04245 [Oscillospiraceae bacterium]|nr:hypothetical protein [Oscillospiraceae bacterium]